MCILTLRLAHFPVFSISCQLQLSLVSAWRGVAKIFSSVLLAATDSDITDSQGADEDEGDDCEEDEEQFLVHAITRQFNLLRLGTSKKKGKTRDRLAKGGD